jgi:hypothetical protein
MAGSFGVYGDRFVGTGQQHALRYNSWLTVERHGEKSYVRWSEFRRSLPNGAYVSQLVRALEFDGVFRDTWFTVRVGKVK